VEGM